MVCFDFIIFMFTACTLWWSWSHWQWARWFVSRTYSLGGRANRMNIYLCWIEALPKILDCCNLVVRLIVNNWRLKCKITFACKSNRSQFQIRTLFDACNFYVVWIKRWFKVSNLLVLRPTCVFICAIAR